jgi:hypothetical protein
MNEGKNVGAVGEDVGVKDGVEVLTLSVNFLTKFVSTTKPKLPSGEIPRPTALTKPAFVPTPLVFPVSVVPATVITAFVERSR